MRSIHKPDGSGQRETQSDGTQQERLVDANIHGNKDTALEIQPILRSLTE